MEDNSENKPTVLITGSTGVIGTTVAEAFASQYTVVGLDVNASKAVQGLKQRGIFWVYTGYGWNRIVIARR